MVTFDAAEPGTTEADWESDPRLRNLPAFRIQGADTVVVIAAHPDDETLGAGGLIAACSRAGIPVRVICVTDGAASHPGDRDIAARRATELERAIATLSPGTTVERLCFPDGETREHEPEIRAALDAKLRTTTPKSVIVAPWRGDGHRDHRIIGTIAAEVARERLLLEYPIWMWHWTKPGHPDVPWDRMRAFTIDADTKMRAIDSFASQIGGTAPMLRADFLEHFQRPQEVFITDDRTLGREYFDAIYAKSEDPWRFRTRWYEERKRRITTAVLPQRRYRRGLEIGCSIGTLTELLVERCDDLLAVDISDEAVEQARALIGNRADVRVQDVLADFPDGPFDLIVLSEVGYYWGASGLLTTLERISASLTRGGVVVACHWRHPVADYPLTGDRVHAMLTAQDWNRVVHHVEDDFILDVFSGDPRSVAQREGLA